MQKFLKKSKKNILLFFLVLFFILLIIKFLPQYIYASTSDQEIITNINYLCLKANHCTDSNTCSVMNVHRAQLSTDTQKKFPANQTIYIAECIYYTENNQTIGKCTTGSNNLDQQIFKENNLSILNEKINYSLEGIYKIENNQAVKINPQVFIANASGETPILEWQSFTPQSYQRKWYGFFIPKDQEETQMGQGGLQQGKVNFPPFQDKDCATIAWDPAGRVFDAKTLEPIPNAQVMLLKNYNGQFADARRTELTIVNPYITQENGGFSFYVSNGEYKLTSSHNNYSFPINDLNKIHPNYQNIYLNPRYGKTGEPKTLIYPAQTNEIINVSNRMEFRDIPLIPNNNIGYNYPLKVYSFVNQINKVSQKIVFYGNVSHPFTKVTLYKKNFNENNQESSQIYGNYLSDYLGKFNFSIPLSSLKENEIITDAQFEKNDLTNLNTQNSQSFIKKIINLLTNYINNKVIAQQNNNHVYLKLNPVIAKIDGVAYDNNGKTLPKTKVGIYLPFSNIPYYTTITDEKGYLKIPANKLPNESFEIRYQTPGEIIKVSTTQFVKQNAQYLSKNKINLNQLVDENKKIDAVTKISPTKKKDINKNFNEKDNHQNFQLPTTKPYPPPQSQTNRANLILVPFIILILLILSVFIILFFYYKRNKSQP